MTRGGEAVSPLNIPAWRELPAAGPARRALRRSRSASTTTPRRWRAARAGSAPRPACATTSRWSSRPASAAASSSTAGCSTAPTATPGHVGHVIVEPDGAICGCGAHGCVEAEASGTAIARITGRPPARRADRDPRRAPAGSSGARSRRSRTCSTCSSRSSAVRSRSATATTFFTAAQAEIDARCRLDFSRGTRVVPGALGDDGPLIGAAAVALFASERACYASWKRPPSMTTTPSWFTVWKIVAPEPSSHILTVSVSPG